MRDGLEPNRPDPYPEDRKPDPKPEMPFEQITIPWAVIDRSIAVRAPNLFRPGRRIAVSAYADLHGVVLNFYLPEAGGKA